MYANFFKHRNKLFNKFGYRLKHTIYALSSGYGKCGVAVIRVSGPKASAALEKMCRSLPAPRCAELKRIKDPETNDFLDQGITLWFPGPASFTGEDCCEFHVHGGPAVISSMFNALAKLDTYRPAEAGEFTRRAFYGGKLDLTSVEGLADLINAETEFQRKQALIQMDGALYQMYSTWRSVLSKSLASLEAFIDFEEDHDIENSVLQVITKDIKSLHVSIEKHLKDGRRGERLRSGVNMTIVGAPNVGKSSLLNCLSQQPTAIVSEIPGTTRDIIKTDLDICGFPVIVKDTAGLRETTTDVIELEGMSRARDALKQTDLLVIVVDGTTLTTCKEQTDIISRLKNQINSLQLPDGFVSKVDCGLSATKNTIVIVNKIDLIEDHTTLLEMKKAYGKRLCLVSCRTEDGMEDMITNLAEHLTELCGEPSSENPSFSQPRHRFCVEETSKALSRFFNYSDTEIDLAAQEIRNALHNLGKITGHVSTEEILDIIFKEFCIGK